MSKDKLPILDQIGFSLGSFRGSFNKGIRSQDTGLAKRGEHIAALAKGERWRGGGSPEKLTAQMRATQNPWVYTAINLRASAVASTPYDIIYNPGGISGEGEPLPNHPAMSVLQNPNPYMGGSYLWHYSQWWADLDGNFFWLVLPDSNGKPAEIWPIPSSDITIETGDDTNVIENYLYEPKHWGGQFNIDPYYMFQHRYPNPFNFFRGMSPLVAALLAAESDNAMAYWNGSFFGSNNTMPSAIINVDSGDIRKPVDPVDLEAIKDKLRSEYAASQRNTVVTNAFKMNVELLSWNQKDMDFLEGRQFTKEEIYSVYGISAGMMDKNATEANAMAAKSTFKENTVYPILRLLDEGLTNQFMRRYYGEGLELRHEDVRPANIEMELKEATTHSEYMTIDEYRETYLDLGPLPNGRGVLLLVENKAPSQNEMDDVDNKDKSKDKPEEVESEEEVEADDVDTDEDTSSKAVADLALYKKKVLGYLKRYGTNQVNKFESDYIDENTVKAIGVDLLQVKTASGVKSVFSHYEKWIKDSVNA